MSLHGQALKAYNYTMDKAMNPKQLEEPVVSKGGGLLSRNKAVNPEDQTDTDDKSTYLLEQFKGLQRMRGKLNNGRT